MYQLLIVDDEPLMQVGIKSMLNWKKLGIEVCGTAANGQIALDLIEKKHPDIVIADIKMPVMDGLELLRIIDEKYGTQKPVFIMLTSYEDFKLAKKAISFQAFDYLIKLELTPEILQNTLEKAIQAIQKQKDQGTSKATYPSHGISFYKEKFLISLLHNLFESDEQMRLQAVDYQIDLEHSGFLCCYGAFHVDGKDTFATAKEMNRFATSLQMVQELTEKYVSCYALSLDDSHFALILLFSNQAASAATDYKAVCKTFETIRNSLLNYYNVSLQLGIGFSVKTPSEICDSYQYARLSFRQTSPEKPVCFLPKDEHISHDAFHLSLFKAELAKAFQEYNADALKTTITALCDVLSAHPHHYVQALDAASNILYLVISLLPDGTETISDIFQNSPDGYMSLYRQNTVEQIVSWLYFLSDAICELFTEKKKDYRNRIVSDVKVYLAEHVYQKLSLNEVAAKFGISPSYLSQLFGKYSDTGFNEYITLLKIKEAKKMLQEENCKVYEIADALQFGSEFYFSKVFKKIEGISPTEYSNKFC